MNNFHMREGKVEFRWKRWRNKKRQEVSSCLMVLFSGAVLLGAGGVALAGPTGGQVTGGQGTITNPNGTTTNINQTSNVLSINWQDFSIAAGETVNFYQPGSTSVAINRVVGGVPSYLAGALNANGRVFILNSAGITFTGTSQVNVGALLATTAMTVNGDPTQAASYSGSGYGAVINQGSISVSNGGFAILAAPYVQNTGFIKADLGTIALAGTNQFTLDLSGTGLINFVVPAGAVEKIVSDGKAVGVDNAGTLQARSGQVLISANVASEVVNAVVNLNGIVDADAFAANGQGGSVLVTAAGDVNVGGQVTARGNGAGNGGQIVTKAGSNDAIGQLAFVSATGGASGGKGGFVEISGKQVGLQGAIDPGSGGSLYIDPTNIHVVAANSSPLIGSSVGTDFIENQLQHTVNVNLAADHNVFFDALADDHQIVGGNGNLTITAGLTAPGNITFGHSANGANPGTNDAIVQGGGFIHMNANGGNIGSSGHAITLITGISNTNASPGVTQAGDIELAAGNDITVKKIQIKSSGSGNLNAFFSANAGHDFTAIGDINVTAIAHGSGIQHATASVNILADNNVTLRNVAVTANASQSTLNGDGANAFANLQIEAHHGSVNILGGVAAAAVSRSSGTDSALANALVNVFANTDLTINGNVAVTANALHLGTRSSSAIANANLQLQANTGTIDLHHGINVSAYAEQHGSESAVACAIANLTANQSVDVDGNTVVNALANYLDSNDRWGARASANLLVNAHNAIDLGSLSVNANALARHGSDSSQGAHASAQADANILGSEVTIGDATVTAHANGTEDGGHANATLQVVDSAFIHFSGDIDVEAVAHGEESTLIFANALVNLQGHDVTVDGATKVFASVQGHSAESIHAAAALVVNAQGDITLHDINVEADGITACAFALYASAFASLNGQNVTVDGTTDVFASLHGSFLREPGSILANAHLIVNAQHDVQLGSIDVEAHGSMSEGEVLNVTASASINGANIAVLGDTKVTAELDGKFAGAGVAVANLIVHATHDASFQGVDVEASAQAFLIIGPVHANALASFTAPDHLSVTGATKVIGRGTVAAADSFSASGNLQVNVASGNASFNAIDVEGLANVEDVSRIHANAMVSDVGVGFVAHGAFKTLASANGTDLHSASMFAQTQVYIHPNATASFLGGVTVSAVAFDRDSTSGPNAELASALFNVLDANVIHVEDGIKLQADALDHFGGLASANASAFLQAPHITVHGDASVLANATGDNGGPVNAIANLTASGATDVTLGGINVQADADNLASGDVIAIAFANVFGSQVTVGNTIVKSMASGHDGIAISNATLLVNDASFILMTGSINVEADLVAINPTMANYGAQALASLTGNSIEVDGPTRVVAKTTGSAGSSILANALLNVNALTTIHFENTIDVVASVDGRNALHVNANPVAQFNGTSLQVDDTLTVLANAHGSSVNGIFAVPVLNFTNVNQVTFNGIDVNAFAHGNNVDTIEASALLVYNSHNNFTDHGQTQVTAVASGSSANHIQADANLFINVNNDASFGGGIDVTASALQFDNGAISVIANAFAHTVAGSSLTLGNDYTVTARASASTANVVTAQAIGFMRAHDINMTTGNVDVAATANGGDNVVGTVAAVATFDAEANGAVTIDGDVSVTANVVYEPNSSHFDQGPSSGSTHGNVFLLANGNIQASTGDINIGGDINVSATLRSNAASFGNFFTVPSFGEGNQYLQKTPTALLTIVDHSGSEVSLQGVTVSANAQLEGNHFQEPDGSNLLGGAIAIATISATSGGVDINGPVTVEATLNAANAGYSTDIPKFALIGAAAVLNVSASGEIDARDVTVTADANVAFVQGFGLPAIGDAIAVANFLGSSVRIDGNVNVQASYAGLFVSQGLTVAALHISASSGPATVDGDVTVNAQTNMTGTETEFGFLGAWDEYVIASASIEADNEASVAGNFNVTAGAQQAPVKFTAFGGANAEMHGSFVSVGGNFDVEALANVTSAERVVADAHGGLFGSHGVEVDGSATVNALAVHGNNSGRGTESGLVLSKAVFSASANNSSGSVKIGHNLTVHANTVENGSEDGVALALASANVFGASGVTVGGVVSAKADLLDYAFGGDSFSTTFGPFAGTVLTPIPLFHYSSVRGGLASAQVTIVDDHSHGVSLGGLSVTANANVQASHFATDSFGDGRNASAFASAFVISNEGPIDIAGDVTGSALAHDAGKGGALAQTLIDLEPAASTGATGSGIGLHVGGNVAMNALADAGTNAEGNVLAVAVLNADADRGGVRIDGNIFIRANAQNLGSSDFHGGAAAYANAHLEGTSGVSVGGGIAVLASINSPENSGTNSSRFKFGNDGDDNFSIKWGHAAAIASLSASDGGVSVGGVVRASAQAIGHGSSADSHLTAATAEVNIEAGDGNIRIGGAKARAVASGTDGSNASANANVKLHASSGSISVSPAGITATALAFASAGTDTGGTHANALGSIAVDAQGGVFIRGNVISLAVAISDGNSNTAHAKTHLAAGGANVGTNDDVGSLGTGSGNVVVIGNIGAFAAADATDDKATASVEIYAHNNLLIVGNDPVASAKVGPSGGTTFAFRQAHVTTNQFASGLGGSATADIDIRVGGFIDVIPPSSLTAVEKLYSLPTDLLTLNSSGGLTIIPLAVQNDDCGVLGIAGMDQTAINKAISCHRKPINVSDLTDTGP